jgi:gamma-glutamylcyclotransferase (GGCT)/AIG2-like uncharacterized protein YtfP
MRGYDLHGLLSPGAKLVGTGSVRGALLDLGDFPGLVDGARRVVGEVYRLDAPELLAVLDRAEGYNFVRRRATVTLAMGRRARAWIYRYRGRRDRARPIPDGDYRRAHPRPTLNVVRAAGRRGCPAGRGAIINRRTQWR